MEMIDTTKKVTNINDEETKSKPQKDYKVS